MSESITVKIAEHVSCWLSAHGQASLSLALALAPQPPAPSTQPFSFLLSERESGGCTGRATWMQGLGRNAVSLLFCLGGKQRPMAAGEFW
jgi:hypothetical protein